MSNPAESVDYWIDQSINQSISQSISGRASKADGKSIDYREIKTTTIALSESIYIGKQGNN